MVFGSMVRRFCIDFTSEDHLFSDDPFGGWMHMAAIGILFSGSFAKCNHDGVAD